jgi:anti-sigma factor RsiW
MAEHPRRLSVLLAKHLDGELSRVEEAELDRLLAAHPEARRELAGWARIETALRAPPSSPSPRLDVERMSRAIATESARQKRRPSTPAPPGAAPRGWAIAFASVLAAAVGIAALVRLEATPAAPVPDTRSAVFIAGSGSSASASASAEAREACATPGSARTLARASERPPVAVHLGEPEAEAGPATSIDARLVQIRF